MLKFPSTPRWYQLAAQVEAQSSDISAGPSGLSESVLRGQDDANVKDLRQIRKLEGYAMLLRKLRVARGLTIEKLAKKIDVEAAELILLESRSGFKASPRTMSALADFYQLSLKKLLQLTGVSKDLDQETENAVIRFAADSESFERLSDEEKKILNQLVKVLSDT